MAKVKKIVDGVVVEVDDQETMVKVIENGVVVEKPMSQVQSLQQQSAPEKKSPSESSFQTGSPESQAYPKLPSGGIQVPDAPLPGLGGIAPAKQGEWSHTKLSPDEERQYREFMTYDPDVNSWAQGFFNDYGTVPDIESNDYDYRGAWKAGVTPKPIDVNGRTEYHWGSIGEMGKDLKSPYHPTKWKSDYMQVTGNDPDEQGLTENTAKLIIGVMSGMSQVFDKAESIKREIESKQFIVNGQPVSRVAIKQNLRDRSFMKGVLEGYNTIEFGEGADPHIQEFANRQVQAVGEYDVLKSLKAGLLSTEGAMRAAPVWLNDILEEATGIPNVLFTTMMSVSPSARDFAKSGKAKEKLIAFSEAAMKAAEKERQSMFKIDGDGDVLDMIDLYNQGKYGEMGRMAVNVTAESGPMMLSAAAASIVTGTPFAGAAFLVPLSASRQYAETGRDDKEYRKLAEKKGITDKEAVENFVRSTRITNANVAGVAEGIPEAMMGPIIGRSFRLFKNGARQIVQQVGGEVGEEAARELADEMAKETASQIMKNYAAGSAIGGVEELTTTLTNEFSDVYLGLSDKTFSEIMRTGLNDAIIGVSSTGMMIAPGTATAMTSKSIDAAKKLRDNFLFFDPSALTDLHTAVDRMPIPESEKEAVKENITKREKAVKSVPENLVSDTETIDLVEEKQELKDQAKSLDPVFAAPVEAKIEEIDKKLAEKAVVPKEETAAKKEKKKEAEEVKPTQEAEPESNKPTPDTPATQPVEEPVSESELNKEEPQEAQEEANPFADIDAGDIVDTAKRRKEASSPRNIARRTALAYTELGKRVQKSEEGKALMSERQKIAKDNGFQIRMTKSGAIVLDDKGKEIRRKPVRRSVESIQESKEEKARIAKVLNAETYDIPHFVAVMLASGTRFDKTEILNFLGKNADIPNWMWKKEGGLKVEMLSEMARDYGLNIDKEDLDSQKISEILEEVASYATNEGRQRALEYADMRYQQQLNGGYTDTQIEEMARELGQYDPDAQDVSDNSFLSQLSEEEIAEIASNIDTYENSNQYIQDAERFAKATESADTSTDEQGKGDGDAEIQSTESEREVRKAAADKRIADIKAEISENLNKQGIAPDPYNNAKDARFLTDKLLELAKAYLDKGLISLEEYMEIASDAFSKYGDQTVKYVKEFGGAIFKKELSDRQPKKKAASKKEPPIGVQERENIEALRKEIEEYTSPEGRAETDAKFNNLSDKANNEASKNLSGIMNSLVPEESQGMYEKNKRTVAETLDNGRRMIDSGAIDPWVFMQSILKNPRPLTPDETAAMVYYKAKLDGRVSSLTEQIDKAVENGDAETVSLADLALAEVEAYIDDYYRFQEASGYEQGLSLRMRQLLLTKEYELANQLRKYKKETGKRFVPAEVMAKFKVFDEAIRELGKRIDEFENRAEKESNTLEILSDPPTGKPRTKSEAAQQLARKVRQGKFVRSARQLSSLQSDPTGLFKFAWDGALEVIATTIEQGGVIADAIDAAVEHLKKSKWYESLSEKGKVKFNETARQSMSQEAYEYAGVKTPEMKDDGSLSIPSSFVKDLIRNGFDTIETATAEAQRILSEYFGIEVSERQVRDAISDYGKMSRLSKDEIDQKMREMRRVGKLVSALEDVQRKKRPLRSGKERDGLTQKEREIRREINALLKDIPQTSEETETAWKTALDATKKRLKNRIEDLETQIREGKKSIAKKDVELDAEAKYLKEEVKRLNDVLKSIEGKPEMTFEQRVRITEQSISKSIEEYERRIKEKDFDPLSKTPVSTPEIEDLRRKREELRKQYRQAYDKSPQKQAGIDSAAMKRLQKQIDEITDKIHGRISIESKKEAVREYGAHAKAMQEVVKSLRETLKETDGYKEMAERRTLENAKKSARKSIEEYERRLREKDFAVRKPKQAQLDNEAKALKAEQQKWKNKFDVEREKNRLDERTNIQRLREGLVDVIGIPKSLVASLDFSSVLRQGGLLSARHPKMAVSAGKTTLKQTFSERAFEQWMDELIVSDIYNEAKKSGLYIASPNAKLLAKEESFVSNIAEMIPIYGRLVRASNRAYSSYLNAIRVSVFADFADQIHKSGLSEKDQSLALKDMAIFINNATGRGTAFEHESSSPELNILFFSPRFALSRANIVMNTATGYAAYHPRVRKEALLTVAAYLSAITTLTLLAVMAGGEGEEDPRSSDFGKIKVGNLRLDPFAGFSQVITFLARMLSGETKSLSSKEVKTLGEGGRFGRNRLDVIGSFIRSKMAPVPSAVVDFADSPVGKTKTYGIPDVAEFEGRVYFKNIVGEEQTIPERAISLMSPIYTHDVLSIYAEEGLPMIALATISDIIGIGAQYHSDSSSIESVASEIKDAKKQKMKEVADAKLELIWNDNKGHYIKTEMVYYIPKESGLSKSDAAEKHNLRVFKEKVGKEDQKLIKAFVSDKGEGESFADAETLARKYLSISEDEKPSDEISTKHLEMIDAALQHKTVKDRNEYISNLKAMYEEYLEEYKRIITEKENKAK